MMQELEKPIIVWNEIKPNTLMAKKEVGRGSKYLVGLREEHIDPIQAWCEEHNCGRRTSFDTFKFKNKTQMTMFLLRWGS